MQLETHSGWSGRENLSARIFSQQIPLLDFRLRSELRREKSVKTVVQMYHTITIARWIQLNVIFVFAGQYLSL